MPYLLLGILLISAQLLLRIVAMEPYLIIQKRNYSSAPAHFFTVGIFMVAQSIHVRLQIQPFITANFKTVMHSTSAGQSILSI